MKTFVWVMIFSIFIFVMPSSSAENVSNLTSGKVALDFKKISVREILQFIAEEMTCNIVMSESVTGNIALHLRKTTWAEAFNVILEMSNLVKKQKGNVLFIATPLEFANRQNSLSEAALMKTVTIKLYHSDVAQIAGQLKNQSDILSPLAHISFNLQENTIWIKDSVDNIPAVLSYIRQLDVPERQLTIAAKIVNIDQSYLSEMGIKLTDIGVKKSMSDFQSTLPAAMGNTFSIAIATLAQNRLLNLELNAMEKSGHSKTIADPKIIARNRKPAVIEAGEEIPYQEKTPNGSTSVAFKKATLSLKVTPTVLPDNRILLELEISQNKISPLSVNGTPMIQTQELQTQAILHNDQTLILGGIFEKNTAQVVNQFPLLGKVPIVNKLLNHTQDQESRKELMILVHPTLLSP